MGDKEPALEDQALAILKGKNNGVKVIGGNKLKKTIDPITGKLYGDMSNKEIIRLCVLLTDTALRFAKENVSLRQRLQQKETVSESETETTNTGKRTSGANF